MMKKVLAMLLLCCMLLASAIAEDDVWGIYTDLDGNEYLLGTAMPCGEGMLLSVDGIVMDGMVLYAENGGRVVQISHAAGLDNGALILYGEGVMGELPAASAGETENVRVQTVNEAGETAVRAKITGKTEWRGQQCLMMNCAADVTIGSPVTDEQGALIGMAAAVWGEGQNNYLVLPAEPVITALRGGIDMNSAAIYDGVSDVLNELTAPKKTETDPRWIIDFKVTAEGSKITVDWSESSHRAGEDERYYVLFMDLLNPFFSYVETEEEQTSMSFYAAPERQYAIWLQCCREDDFSSSVNTETMKFAATEKAELFKEFGYHDRELYLGVVPAGSEENSVKAEKLDKITVADIIDENTDFCLQAVSAYEVTEEITMSMQTVLTTPDHYALILDSAYIFIPEMMENDVWNASLESLFATYVQFSGFIVQGEYSIDYYFDGQLAGSLTFTIE